MATRHIPLGSIAHRARRTGPAGRRAAVVAAAGFALLVAGAPVRPVHAAEAALAAAVAEYRAVGGALEAEGVVEAVRQAVVAAQVPGRILEVRTDAGRAVKAGEVLARIDDRESVQVVAAGQAQVARAEADFANARVTLERTRSLTEQKFISKAALDKAQSDFDAARAGLEAARASGRQSQAAHGYTTVTAPFAGVIATRHVQAGDLAQPGTPLFTLYDPAKLRVVANVPQDRVREARAAGGASLELSAIGVSVSAASMQILPAADARSHSTQVWLDLPPTVKDAYPGLFARAWFGVATAKRLVIPASAVAYRSEVSGVYVLPGQGAPRFRQIRVGGPAGADAVEVLAGLQAGERVALDPVRALATLKAAAR